MNGELPKKQYVKILEDNEVGTVTICRVDAETGTVKSEQTFAVPKDYDAYRNLCEVGAAHEMYEALKDAEEHLSLFSDSVSREISLRIEKILKKARGEK